MKPSLPAQTTPLIGREQEQRDLSQLLSDRDVRIITILAPGGMGKTRLVLEAAAHSLPSFPDGACFSSLAQIQSPADLVTAIGRAVGLEFYGAGDPQQQLFDFLRGQTLLLVLDNFEHLLAAAPLTLVPGDSERFDRLQSPMFLFV